MTTRLIGGEMPLWSDPSPAAGPVLAALLAGAGGRTLVAGPHAPELIEALPPGDLTVLVRGLADATALEARFAGRRGVTVCCGCLTRLPTDRPYDQVVALDGLGRLASAETADLPWPDGLARLLAALRPGGRLLLGLDNPFGLHRLVSLPSRPGDAEWTVLDSPRPDQLAAAGVVLRQEYAAFPAPGAPTALVSRETLAERALGGFWEAALRRACTPADPVPADLPLADPVLADPARLAVGAVRNGLAADLAPAWIVVASPGPEPTTLPELPAALLGLPGGGVDVVGSYGIRGDGSPVPAGRTLHDLMMAAARRRDQPALRALVTSWQAGEAAGVPADQVIAGPDGTVTPLVPAGDPLGALRRFAADSIAGDAHLWPAPADEVTVTALLAAMGGREVDPAAVPAVPFARPDEYAFRELLATRDRLARELAEAREQHRSYERTLAARDAALRRAQQLNRVLSATVPGRAATTLLGGVRVVRRALKKL
jgi:hypothetical protein